MRLVSKKTQPAFNIWLEMTGRKIQLDLSKIRPAVSLPIGDYRAGHTNYRPFKLSTVFPFGIARVWLWLTPPG